MGAEVVNCTCEAATSGFSILEVFLSSFLAFLSALAVEALWEWHKTTSLRKQLKKTLAEELKNLKEALAVIKDDEIYINPTLILASIQKLSLFLLYLCINFGELGICIFLKN